MASIAKSPLFDLQSRHFSHSSARYVYCTDGNSISAFHLQPCKFASKNCQIFPRCLTPAKLKILVYPQAHPLVRTYHCTSNPANILELDQLNDTQVLRNFSFSTRKEVCRDCFLFRLAQGFSPPIQSRRKSYHASITAFFFPA